MNRFGALFLGFLIACGVATPVCAAEQVVVPKVLGPEGPLVVNGALYYVSWTPVPCCASTARPLPS